MSFSKPQRPLDGVVLNNDATIITYRGVNGTIEWSKEDNCYHGKLATPSGNLYMYEGKFLDDFATDFKETVELYLEEEKGWQPFEYIENDPAFSEGLQTVADDGVCERHYLLDDKGENVVLFMNYDLFSDNESTQEVYSLSQIDPKIQFLIQWLFSENKTGDDDNRELRAKIEVANNLDVFELKTKLVEAKDKINKTLDLIPDR
jgi:hypothetical protein